MIAKISDPRGKRVGGLIRYLFGPGRREEHTDPHIVAGWRHPAELEPPQRPGGHRDFRRLTGLLQQPHAALGPRGFDRPVWHCAVRAAPEDRVLSDDEWAQIAGDIMHRTGLAPAGPVPFLRGPAGLADPVPLIGQPGLAAVLAGQHCGYGALLLATGPPPGVRPARRTRRRAGTGGRRPRGSRCGGP